MMAVGIFHDEKVELVACISARAGESVPVEVDGSEHGQVAVVDLVARQA
jgi:hypothetical protein